MVTQLRWLVINAVISGSAHDIELDIVYESTRRKGRSRRAPHAVHDPTTGRGPQVRLAYVGETKEIDPTSNAAFVVGFRTPEFCSWDRHYVGGWCGLRLLALESAGASLCSPAPR